MWLRGHILLGLILPEAWTARGALLASRDGDEREVDGMAKKPMGIVIGLLLAIAVPCAGWALGLDEVPEAIRTQLEETAEAMAIGKFLIVGRVVFQDGRGIEGGACAEVQVNFRNAIDVPLAVEAGGWFYTDDVIESDYAEGGSLLVRALGYAPIDLPVTVDGGIIVIDEIALTSETGYAIEGTVRDAAGAPQQGISVDLFFPLSSGCWEPLMSMFTGDDGVYRFDGLSSAEHQIRLGAPFGFVWMMSDTVAQPAVSPAVVDLALIPEMKMEIDYVYQPDGSRDFSGPGVASGTIEWPAQGLGFDFEDGMLEGYDEEDLRDLDLIQDGTSLFVRCVYLTGENGFLKVLDTDFEALTEARVDGYDVGGTLCEVGDVFVVRTYEGHYAKFVILAIEPVVR